MAGVAAATISQPADGLWSKVNKKLLEVTAPKLCTQDCLHGWSHVGLIITGLFDIVDARMMTVGSSRSRLDDPTLDLRSGFKKLPINFVTSVRRRSMSAFQGASVPTPDRCFRSRQDLVARQRWLCKSRTGPITSSSRAVRSRCHDFRAAWSLVKHISVIFQIEQSFKISMGGSRIFDKIWYWRCHSFRERLRRCQFVVDSYTSTRSAVSGLSQVLAAQMSCWPLDRKLLL